MSVINHDYRHVFIHNPKTAGSSMERQFWVGGLGHDTARVLIPRAPEGYLSWGFVRHPCDRLLSWYSAACQHRPRWPDVEACDSFEAFVLRLVDWPKRPAMLSQTTMLCWPDGRIAVDFLGRFERLESDWLTICLRLGIPWTQLPRLNASKHPPWQSVFTESMLAVVGTIYADDFGVFGYKLTRRSIP